MKIENFQTEMDFIALVRARHLKLAAGTDDEDTTTLHIEIAHLFAEALHRYFRLAEAYKNPPDVGTTE